MIYYDGMYANQSGFNITWAIIAMVILGNIFLFNLLFKNVNTYSNKIISNNASKYQLEDI